MYNGNYVSTSNPLPVTDSGAVTGCLGITPLACATVLQASAYGVKGDNATDNTTALGNAITAACNVAGSGLGGVTLQLPTGRVLTGPQRVPCSGVVIAGYGKGYGGGSGQYPTAIAPATTLVCNTSSALLPLLLIAPTIATAQANNQVQNLGFDGNGDECGYGLAASGELMPTFTNLSFVGFGTVAMELAGATIGGSGLGSVVHAYFNGLQFSMTGAGDGVGLQLDGVTGSDVFGLWGNNVSCVQNANPCIVINKTDHNQITNIQVGRTSGGMATYSMVIGCNAVSFYASNLLMQQPTYVDGSVECPGGGSLVPKGTMFYNYQDFQNDAPAPETGTNVTLVMTDDKNNWFGGNQGGGATATFFCFGLPNLDSNSQNGCTLDAPIIWTDQYGWNLSIGTRGAQHSQAMHIEFCPSGCGAGTTYGTVYDSFIDENGCLAFGTVGGPSPSPSPDVETAFYCKNSATIDQNWPAGKLVGITTNGALTPVPSPTPVATTPASLYASTAATSTTAPTASPNTYQQFPCGSGSTGCSSGNISITTGVNSTGNGEWLVTFSFPMWVAAAVTTTELYGCAESASTFTLLDATRNASANCVSSLSNSFAGTTNWGDSAAAFSGLQSRAEAHMIVANSTTVTAGCYFAQNAITSQPTVYSYCSLLAVPY